MDVSRNLIQVYLYQLIRDISFDSVSTMCDTLHKEWRVELQDCLTSPQYRTRREMLEREKRYRRSRARLPFDFESARLGFRDVNDFVQWEQATYAPFLNELQRAAADFGGVEGSTWAEYGGNEMSMDLATKRLELMDVLVFAVAMWQTHVSNVLATRPAQDLQLSDFGHLAVVNVGFNAGHSAAMFLSLFSNMWVYSFDLCIHPYTAKADALIRSHFGDRHRLICGDSRHTLPRFIARADRPLTFAAAFVDGNHTYYGARNDLENLALLGTTHSPILLIADDCRSPFDVVASMRKPIVLSVSLAWRHAVGVADTTAQPSSFLCVGTSAHGRRRESISENVSGEADLVCPPDARRVDWDCALQRYLFGVRNL